MADDDKRKGAKPTVPVTPRRRRKVAEPDGGGAQPTVAGGDSGSGAQKTRPARSGDGGVPLRRVLGAGDRYEIVKLIGRGGFGKVYEGVDRHLGQAVAIKTLNVADLEDDELETFLRKFRDEAREVQPLEHQGIVRVHDYGEDAAQQQPFIVMSLIRGGTLRDLLDRQERLDIDEAVDMGIAIADALEYVHRKDVLHRDIKPENIFCLRDGSYKIGDFGIARHGQAGRGTRSTFRGAGTPAYMAPEQIATPSHVDRRADVFSLCVVLFEALTGERPYLPVTLDFDPEESRRSSERARRAVERNFSEVPSLRAVAPDVPKKLAAVIERGIDPDPNKRFKSCRELANALDDSFEEDGWELPSPRLLGGGALALVTVIGLGWLLTSVEMPSIGWPSFLSGEGDENATPAVALVDKPSPTASPLPRVDLAEPLDAGDDVIGEAQAKLARVRRLRSDVPARARGFAEFSLAERRFRDGEEKAQKNTRFFAARAIEALVEAEDAYRKAIARAASEPTGTSMPVWTFTKTKTAVPTRSATATRTLNPTATRTKTTRSTPTTPKPAVPQAVPPKKANTKVRRPTKTKRRAATRTPKKGPSTARPTAPRRFRPTSTVRPTVGTTIKVATVRPAAPTRRPPPSRVPTPILRVKVSKWLQRTCRSAQLEWGKRQLGGLRKGEGIACVASTVDGKGAKVKVSYSRSVRSTKNDLKPSVQRREAVLDCSGSSCRCLSGDCK